MLVMSHSVTEKRNLATGIILSLCLRVIIYFFLFLFLFCLSLFLFSFLKYWKFWKHLPSKRFKHKEAVKFQLERKLIAIYQYTDLVQLSKVTPLDSLEKLLLAMVSHFWCFSLKSCNNLTNRNVLNNLTKSYIVNN